MSKSENPKAPRRQRKNRATFDITFQAPKSLSLSDSYFADTDQPSQWGGKLAALFEPSHNDPLNAMERIEANVKTLLNQTGKRSGRVAGKLLSLKFSHRIPRPLPRNKAPKTTLWVSGVKMTAKLSKRLLAMSEEDREAFWHEQLKNMEWHASPPATMRHGRAKEDTEHS
jgi:hypothetical protein